MKKLIDYTAKVIIVVSLLALAGNVFGQSIAGKWMTIDDETGKVKSIVKIYTGQERKVLREDPEVVPQARAGPESKMYGLRYQG